MYVCIHTLTHSLVHTLTHSLTCLRSLSLFSFSCFRFLDLLLSCAGANAGSWRLFLIDCVSFQFFYFFGFYLLIKFAPLMPAVYKRRACICMGIAERGTTEGRSNELWIDASLCGVQPPREDHCVRFHDPVLHDAHATTLYKVHAAKSRCQQQRDPL